MPRSRRSPAQKAVTKALQIARERRGNKLDLPSASPSSHPPVPNSIHQSNPCASPPIEDLRNSVAVTSASQRAHKRNEIKLAHGRERERIATLERDLQDALRRESELREEIKALKEGRREAERVRHLDAQLNEQESTDNTMAAPDGAFE